MFKKLLTIILVVIVAIANTACTSHFKNFASKTKAAFGGGDYDLFVYSGGQIIRLYKIFNGFVNEEEGGAGWYFNCNQQLVRLSGQVVVEPMDFVGKQPVINAQSIECRQKL